MQLTKKKLIGYFIVVVECGFSKVYSQEANKTSENLIANWISITVSTTIFSHVVIRNYNFSNQMSLLEYIDGVTKLDVVLNLLRFIAPEECFDS